MLPLCCIPGRLLWKSRREKDGIVCLVAIIFKQIVVVGVVAVLCVVVESQGVLIWDDLVPDSNKMLLVRRVNACAI